MTFRRPTFFLLLGLVFLLTRIPFAYTLGAPDGDQIHMALGAYDAIRSGAYFQGQFLYGAAIAPGYYALLFLLKPVYANHPEGLFPLMTVLGIAFGLVGQLAFGAILWDLWGRSASVLGSVLLLFAPGWWELTTYGHPSVLAFSALMLALFACVKAYSASPFRWGWLATGLIAFSTAAALRADTLLAVAAFPAVIWIRRRSGRDVLVAGAAFALAGVVSLLAAQSLVFAGEIGGERPAVAKKILGVLNFSLPILRKKLEVWGAGIGPLSMVACLFGILACFARRKVDPIVLTLAVLGPEILWWLQVEGPFRHLLIAAVFALVPIAALAAEWRVRTAAICGLAIVISNQVVMAATYEPLLRSYSWAYRAPEGDRRWSTRAPIGDWFSHHLAAERAVDRERKAANWLAGIDRKRILVVYPSPYRIQLEIMRRSHSTRYRGISARGGASWSQLDADDRHYLFLEGDPEPTRLALEKAFAAGSLEGCAIYVPEWSQPTNEFQIPDRFEVLRAP